MLNIPPELARHDILAHLPAERGIDTFVLMSDDPGLLRRHGQEIAPVVRELVGA
jgi:hypothetical protein